MGTTAYFETKQDTLEFSQSKILEMRESAEPFVWNIVRGGGGVI